MNLHFNETHIHNELFYETMKFLLKKEKQHSQITYKFYIINL
jgi:hypothetical protein